MSLTEDYLRLQQSLAGKQTGTAVKATQEQIAGLLHCTARNAKLILHKMVDRGWIGYIPGRGRGHLSEITFFLDYEDVFMQAAKRLVEEGKVEAAFRMVQSFGEHTRFNKTEFSQWLSGYFGYSVEHTSETYRETLKLPVYREINTRSALDPAQSFYSLDMHLIEQQYDTLVELDSPGGQYKGALAHHWKRNASATEWTFYLRKGVLFHNGREMTSEDVRASFTRLARHEFEQRWLTEDIEEILILSRYAISIRLKQPNFLFLDYVSYPPMSIVPLGYSLDTHAFQSAGTGSYRFAEADSGKFVLEAFDRHYAGRALLDRIELIYVPTGGPLLLSPSASLLVETDDVPLKQTPFYPGWKQKELLTGCTLLTFNQRNGGPLADQQLREAIRFAVDRRRLVRELAGSRECPADGFEYAESEGRADLEGDLAQAAHHLKRSIYQGQRLSLYTYRRHQRDANWLQKELKAAGISIQVEIVQWKELLLPSVRQQADMILFELPSTEGIIRQIESYKSHFIRSHLSEAQATAADEQVSKLLASPEADNRKRILNSIEQRYKEEAVFLFLAHKSVSSRAHPVLQGASLNARGWVDFKNLWYDSNP